MPTVPRKPILPLTTQGKKNLPHVLGEDAMPVVVALPLLVALWVPAAAQSATLAELAIYSGPDRTERLIAGAKKEGVLTIYSSVTTDDMRVLIAAFEKKYGVKMQFWRASSESILRRALIEQRAGRYEVDAVETSAAEMESLHREGMLQEVRSPHLADIVPAALRPHREWVGDRLNIISAGYNTKLVRKDELPKTYEDFADPRWKGRLGIESDDAVWFGALANALGEEKIVKLFRDMVRDERRVGAQGPHAARQSRRQRRGAVRAHALSLQGGAVEEAGAPLDWYVIPPGFARFLGTGVMRRAPHPHAAVLFLDFMLYEAQQLLVTRDFTPTNMKVRPLDVPFSVIDPAQILDQGDSWTKLYDEIVVKQGKKR